FSKTQESKESEDLITWVPYSKKTFNKLRKEGKAIFVDFTADWCITCKFNEHTAIDTSAVRALFRKHQIVPMKADWTNANVEITKALQAFGRVGVPYYVFYPAGDDTQPVTFSEFLTESDLIKAFSMP
ncbi:MAG TPA: thioredoxin family protein, partial [Chthoniobacterales bacterium]|nr:thioredoxin family protein [Chthoniobacterales bacterium]